MNGAEIVNCVEKKTYNLTTLMKWVTQGLEKNSSLPGPWYPEFSFSSAGLLDFAKHLIPTEPELQKGRNLRTSF